MTAPSSEPTVRHRRVVDSPVGPLVLVGGDAGLRAVLWGPEDVGRVRLGPVVDGEHAVLDAAAAQLAEWFAGTRRSFDLPLDLEGTSFQRAVWDALRWIEFGRTWTYRQVAEAVGSPAAVRAVGAAVGRNPVSVVLPCHRVVGADGRLTGFAGGLEAKRFLLEHEARTGTSSG